MNARARLPFAALVAFASLAAQPAHAVLGEFNLTSTQVTPPSGVATTADTLTIHFAGVAGTSNVPQDVFLLQLTPTSYEFYLTTPNTAGAAIPTPWNRQTTLGPLAAGAYDFFAKGIIGFGTPNQTITGEALVVDNFLVVPEPAAWLTILTAAAIIFNRRRSAVQQLRSAGTR